VAKPLVERIFTTSKTVDPTAKFSSAVFIARLLAGHIFSYPLAFVWAVASMPLVTHLNHAKLETIADNEKAIGDFVLYRVAWPAGIAFVVVHVASVVWALAQKHPRGHWIFFGGFGFVLAGGILFGAASWIWLLTL
jgi:hypothetical protein